MTRGRGAGGRKPEVGGRMEEGSGRKMDLVVVAVVVTVDGGEATAS